MDTLKNIFNRLFGAPPRTSAEENAILLFDAIEHGRTDIVKQLITENPECLQAHKHGCPPFVWAASYMQLDVMKELRLHGAHLEERDNQGATAFMTVIEGWIQEGATLHANPGQPVSSTTSKDIADWLLLQGAQIDARDIAGSTPLSKTVLGFDQIAEYLLKNGAHTETRYTDMDMTLLMSAARSKSHSIIQVLLDHGAKIGATDVNGKTALDHLQDNRTIGNDFNQTQSAFLLERAMEKHLTAEKEAARIAWEEEIRHAADIASKGTTQKIKRLKKIVLVKRTPRQ